MSYIMTEDLIKKFSIFIPPLIGSFFMPNKQQNKNLIEKKKS
jgi:hypothetical protein